MQNSCCKKITLVLNPAHHQHNTNRTINGVKEQTIATNFCQFLQQSLEAANSNIRVIVYQPTGPITIDSIASFTNQMDTDLYVGINFYEKKQETQECGIYYFSLNPITDSWKQKQDSLTFVPFFKAHQKNFSVTKQYAKKFHEIISEQLPTLKIHTPLTGPFCALAGIQALALMIELSLIKDTQWQQYAYPVATALLQLCKRELL